MYRAGALYESSCMKIFNSDTRLLVGYESVSTGVGNFNPAEDDVTYKAYYQWVPFVLFLQVRGIHKPRGQ